MMNDQCRPFDRVSFSLQLLPFDGDDVIQLFFNKMVGKLMLLHISSAIIRRAIGSNGSYFASAFLSNNAPSFVPPLAVSSSSSISPIIQTSKQQWRQLPISSSSTARFMSTDAPPAEEKTEEEKAAIKAAREERK